MPSLSTILAEKTGTMVGQIYPFAGSAAPSGYLLCDGSAVSRATYANLFAAIGTLYGAGNGSTTFNLPNTAGLFPQGVGSQSYSSKTFNGSTLGSRVVHTTAVNGLTASTSCTPNASVNNTDLTHTHSLTDFFGQGTVSSASGNTEVVAGSNATANQSDVTGSALGNHGHTATYGVSHVTTITSTDTETAPAAISLNFIIKT